jgi:hypothetical protein
MELTELVKDYKQKKTSCPEKGYEQDVYDLLYEGE